MGFHAFPASVPSCPEVESFLTSGKVFDLIRLVLILGCLFFSAARRFEATPSTPAWMWQRMRGGLKRKWLQSRITLSFRQDLYTSNRHARTQRGSLKSYSYYVLLCATMCRATIVTRH